LWMQKQGYRPTTIKACVQTLKSVAKRANLLDPEAVKQYIGSAQVGINRKQKITEDVARFYATGIFHSIRQDISA
jgi:hypothetical protein